MSRALWSGLDILKAHLERYSRETSKEEFRSRSDKVLLKGTSDLAVEVAGNLMSFGLLGAGKTLLESGKTLYDLDREQRRIERLDVSPGAADRRANDELTQTILADLARLTKPPPIPLVIVLDDAQWLSHDEGTTAFAEALVRRARLENWPVLVILTSWEREWRDSERSGAAPASLLAVENGDPTLYLGRAPELAEVVTAAFPGLTEPQCTTILEQVDGNPAILGRVADVSGAES